MSLLLSRICLSVCMVHICGACIYGELRFVNYTYDGLVEICINNTWGTICNNGWTNINAQIVCRQLGHDRLSGYIGALYRLSSTYYGQGNGSIFLDDVHCIGTERRLLDCSHAPVGQHNCDHSQDVGVICLGSHKPFGTIILSRNNIAFNSYYFGTIRVYYSRWGNIFYDSFYGSNEANVICHQLGYIGASSYSRAGIVNYGTDTLSMLWSNLRCENRQYLSVSQCSYSSIINSGCANNTYDATVSCYTSKIWDSILFPGMIRLQNGTYSNQGLVEVYCNGYWGTICNSGFSYTDATTLCRQLGYDRAGQVNHLALTGIPGQPIWSMNMLSYTGDTCFNTRNSCPLRSYHNNCTHARDVTISCNEGFVRLSVSAKTCDNSSRFSTYSIASNTPFVSASLNTFSSTPTEATTFYTSPYSTPSKSTILFPSSSNLDGAIIGSVIGALIILIAVIVVCIFCCHYIIRKAITTGKHLHKISVNEPFQTNVINCTVPDLQYPTSQYPYIVPKEEGMTYIQEYPAQFVEPTVLSPYNNPFHHQYQEY